MINVSDVCLRTCTSLKPLHGIISYCICILSLGGLFIVCEELAWRSGSVMNCQATARGSIYGGNGVKPSFRPLQGTVNGGAVSE